MVVVEVCGDLTLLSAGGALVAYDQRTSKSKVINAFTESNNNNNNNNNNDDDGEKKEEEEEEGGGEVNEKKQKKEDNDAGDLMEGSKEEEEEEEEGRKENGKPDEEGKKKKKKKKSDENGSSNAVSRLITAAKFSPCGRWLVVGGGCKVVEVWRVGEWRMAAAHRLPKKPTALAVTDDSTCVFVADRAGDVYKFDLPSTTTTTTTATATNTTTTTTTTTATATATGTEENMKPVLGHLSILLDVAITPDGRFLASCDRDEKVRLSHLSHPCLIHTFLLGHREFVTALAPLSAHPPHLLSCSGDGTIKLWNYVEGKCLSTLEVAPHLSSASSTVTEEERESPSTPPPPSPPPPAVKKILAISSSSSSSSFLVAALVYRAKEVLLCKVEGDQLHFISTAPLRGEPSGGAWRKRRRKTDGREGGGGGGEEELVLVVEDGIGGGEVVVMEVVEDKLVEEEEAEEAEEEGLPGLRRKYRELSREAPSSQDSLEFLYKQKYDNVEEYLKKKRERMELMEKGQPLTKRGRFLKGRREGTVKDSEDGDMEIEEVRNGE